TFEYTSLLLPLDLPSLAFLELGVQGREGPMHYLALSEMKEPSKLLIYQENERSLKFWVICLMQDRPHFVEIFLYIALRDGGEEKLHRVGQACHTPHLLLSKHERLFEP